MNAASALLDLRAVRRTLQRGYGRADAPDRSSTSLIDWRGTARDLLWPRRPLQLARKLGGLVRDCLGGWIVRVPLDRCMNPYAWVFGEPGWNYYRDLAAELLAEPETPFRETRFFRFFRAVHAPSFTDNLCFDDPGRRRGLPTLPYGSLPWGVYEWEPIRPDPLRFYDRSHRPRRSDANGRNPFFEHVFYEKSDATLRSLHRDHVKVAALVRSFLRFGYRPLLGGGYALPTVGVLVRHSGDMRFVVKDGNHRLGLLGALGCRDVTVRLDPRRFPPVFEAGLAGSPWVTSGLLPLSGAEALFALLFERDGRERARALGVLPGGRA